MSRRRRLVVEILVNVGPLRIVIWLYIMQVRRATTFCYNTSAFIYTATIGLPRPRQTANPTPEGQQYDKIQKWLLF